MSRLWRPTGQGDTTPHVPVDGGVWRLTHVQNHNVHTPRQRAWESGDRTRLGRELLTRMVGDPFEQEGVNAGTDDAADQRHSPAETGQ